MFEVTKTNPDGTPIVFLDFAAIQAYLIKSEKQLGTALGDYTIVLNSVISTGEAA